MIFDCELCFRSPRNMKVVLENFVKKTAIDKEKLKWTKNHTVDLANLNNSPSHFLNSDGFHFPSLHPNPCNQQHKLA